MDTRRLRLAGLGIDNHLSEAETSGVALKKLGRLRSRGRLFVCSQRWRRELFDTDMGKHSLQSYVGVVSIGTLWKETYYAIPARDHGGG